MALIAMHRAMVMREKCQLCLETLNVKQIVTVEMSALAITVSSLCHRFEVQEQQSTWLHAENTAGTKSTGVLEHQHEHRLQPLPRLFPNGANRTAKPRYDAAPTQRPPIQNASDKNHDRELLIRYGYFLQNATWSTRRCSTAQ
jgi:hypothetical protein